MATTTVQVRLVLRKALDDSTPTLRDIARSARVSYHAMRQYRLGARSPSPAIVRRVARVLRQRAKKLQQHATALDGLAKNP